MVNSFFVFREDNKTPAMIFLISAVAIRRPVADRRLNVLFDGLLNGLLNGLHNGLLHGLV